MNQRAEKIHTVQKTRGTVEHLLEEDGKDLRSHIKQRDLGEGWRRRCTGGQRRTLLVERRMRQPP
jgi:hypothetical protein